MKNRQKNKRGIMLLLLLSFCYFLSITSITSPPSTLFISTISYFSAIFSKYSIPWRVFNTLFVITVPFFSCFKFFSTNFYSFLSVYFAIIIQYISHRFNIILTFRCISNCTRILSKQGRMRFLFYPIPFAINFAILTLCSTAYFHSCGFVQKNGSRINAGAFV